MLKYAVIVLAIQMNISTRAHIRRVKVKSHTSQGGPHGRSLTRFL